MSPEERRRKLAAERARQDIADILAEMHAQGLDMGEISCLILDLMVDWFEGISAIRKVVNGTAETLPALAVRHAQGD